MKDNITYGYGEDYLSSDIKDYVCYKNGNYKVFFNLRDGTKLRMTKDDKFEPEFAESMDVTISTKCDRECKYCYMGCTKNGEQPDLLHWKFLDSLHPYTEIAINLNFPVHPQLVKFLNVLKDKKVIVNITINQLDFEKYSTFVLHLSEQKLIYGIGVSLINPTDEFINKVKLFDNAVIHVINGVVTEEQINKLRKHGLKILVLGFKHINRGIEYYWKEQEEVEKNHKYLQDNIIGMLDDFEVVCFDCLGLSQLRIKDKIPKEDFDRFYLGEDGAFTFAINLVKGTFSLSSSSMFEYSIDGNDIDDMFSIIKKEREDMGLL